MVTLLDVYCFYRPHVLISFNVPDPYACRGSCCGLCVRPIGAHAILRCGQLGVDMAGRELAASDIIVLAGGY